MSQQRTLTVPGRYDQIRTICEFISEGARIAQFEDDDVFHIELACDEACTNIIEHAYEGEDQGPIIVDWKIDDNDFIITFTDKGQAFKPEEIPVPMSSQDIVSLNDLDNLKVGGLGLHFMKKLMDTVTFVFDKEKGNQLIMAKQMKGAK